jgi:hypothetical protein
MIITAIEKDGTGEAWGKYEKTCDKNFVREILILD